MSQIHLVARLQALDSEIAQKKARLTIVLRSQGETDALRAARARAEALTAERDSYRTQQRRLDGEIASLTARITSAERRLYSGEVKNPKELGDLQASVEATKRERGRVEDQLLEILVELEDVSAALAAAESERDRIEAAWTADQASLRDEQHTLALALNELLPQRQAQAEKLDARLLTMYDNLRRLRGGVGAVAIVGDQCGSCRVSLPSTKVKAVREGKVATCDSCGRLLLP